jgi:hypothetical protein
VAQIVETTQEDASSLDRCQAGPPKRLSGHSARLCSVRRDVSEMHI